MLPESSPYRKLVQGHVPTFSDKDFEDHNNLTTLDYLLICECDANEPLSKDKESRPSDELRSIIHKKLDKLYGTRKPDRVNNIKRLYCARREFGAAYNDNVRALGFLPIVRVPWKSIVFGYLIRNLSLQLRRGLLIARIKANFSDMQRIKKLALSTVILIPSVLIFAFIAAVIASLPKLILFSILGAIVVAFLLIRAQIRT